MKTQDSIRGVLIRELQTLARELEAYDNEADIWRVPEGISNSAGNLALHLAGNLQSFIGALLGGSNYRRDRDAEFSRRNVPLEEMIREIDHTISAVEATMQTLPDETLTRHFPVAFGETRVDTQDFLIHLASHLAFHLGQIDYHRRLVTGDNRSIHPLPIPALPSAEPTD